MSKELNWQTVFLRGLAPQISSRGLLALLRGLERDDPRLIQGKTVVPSALFSLEGEEPERACAIGFCGWQAGAVTAMEVGDFFARVIKRCDRHFKLHGAYELFTNHFDSMPRAPVFRQLAALVRRVLKVRRKRARARRKVVAV